MFRMLSLRGIYILKIIILETGVTGLRLFARLKKEYEVITVDKNAAGVAGR